LGLSDEPQLIVSGAGNVVLKFLNNNEDYEPFRRTVLGFGGTGKSLIINTIITIVLKITQCNDSVKVAAPSGGAAFNVQGCTIHRAFGAEVSGRKLASNLSNERQVDLAANETPASSCDRQAEQSHL